MIIAAPKIVASVALFLIAPVGVPNGSAMAQIGGAQEQVVEEEGLHLARDAEGNYHLRATDFPLESLAQKLAGLTGAEFSIEPELLEMSVNIETEHISLDELLRQLRAAVQANLIVARNADQAVSRVWMTATQAQLAPDPAAAGNLAANDGAGLSYTQMLMADGEVPMPQPTGNEVEILGVGEETDVQALIEEGRLAAEAAAENETAGAEGSGAGTGADPAASRPPGPMAPDALERFFAGDSRKKVYHRLNCVQAMYLPSQNKIWFGSREEAIAQGYTPHAICVGR